MTPIKEVTQDRYDEMLNVLPPALWLDQGFLVGEPWNHRTCNVSGIVRSTFAALFHCDGRYYEAEGPMTSPEFRAVTPTALRDAVSKLVAA